MKTKNGINFYITKTNKVVIYALYPASKNIIQQDFETLQELEQCYNKSIHDITVNDMNNMYCTYNIGIQYHNKTKRRIEVLNKLNLL